jgi:hypothetical protein
MITGKCFWFELTHHGNELYNLVIRIMVLPSAFFIALEDRKTKQIKRTVKRQP